MVYKTLAQALVVGAAVFAAATSAQARQWWIIDGSNNTCHLATTEDGAAITPDLMERGLRQDPAVAGVPNVRVFKFDNGDVWAVSIVVTYRTGNHMQLSFIVDPGVCNSAREFMTLDGRVISRSDLR